MSGALRAPTGAPITRQQDVGSYLQQFVENAHTLPAELQRNFTLMRELDEKARELQATILREHRAFATSKDPRTNESTQKFIEQIKSQQQSCQGICDEKISLATQSYDRVDAYIRQLDADLKRYEDEATNKDGNNNNSSSAAVERERGGGRERDREREREAAAAAMTGGGGGGGGNVRERRESGMQNQAKKQQKQQVDHSAPMPSDDMLIDPNEPTYCLCKQVSFGEMIACDNPDCPIEWFHFQCVGLTNTSIKGNRWFCPDCRARMRHGLLKI